MVGRANNVILVSLFSIRSYSSSSVRLSVDEGGLGVTEHLFIITEISMSDSSTNEEKKEPIA